MMEADLDRSKALISFSFLLLLAMALVASELRADERPGTPPAATQSAPGEAGRTDADALRGAERGAITEELRRDAETVDRRALEETLAPPLAERIRAEAQRMWEAATAGAVVEEHGADTVATGDAGVSPAPADTERVAEDSALSVAGGDEDDDDARRSRAYEL